MSQIIPFQGILPIPSLVNSILQGKEFSSFPTISRDFEKYFKEGKIVEDKAPAFYIYRVYQEGRSFTGLWATTAAKDLSNGIIRKHEKIYGERSKVVEDMFWENKFDFNPILITYFPEPKIDHWLTQEMKAKAFISYSNHPEGTQIEIWKVNYPSSIQYIVSEFSKLNPVYLADGHHRASAFQNWLQKENPKNAISEYRLPGFSSIYFSLNEVEIKPYHRFLQLNQPNLINQALECIRSKFHMSPLPSFQLPTKKGRATLLDCNGGIYTLELGNSPKDNSPRGLVRAPKGESTLYNLDVSIIQNLFIDCFKINQKDSLGDLHFMGSIKKEDILSWFKESPYSLGFFLAPPHFGEIQTIADLGLTMPPKSTYFEPKIPSGLIINRLNMNFE